MATAQKDIRSRIADALGDKSLREAIDRQAVEAARTVRLVEAVGTTFDPGEDQ